MLKRASPSDDVLSSASSILRNQFCRKFAAQVTKRFDAFFLDKTIRCLFHGSSIKLAIFD